MSYEEMKRRLLDLERENAKLKEVPPLRLKASPKGCVSVYIPGRNFPFSFYTDEYQMIDENRGLIKEFIERNEGLLKAR